MVKLANWIASTDVACPRKKMYIFSVRSRDTEREMRKASAHLNPHSLFVTNSDRKVCSLPNMIKLRDKWRFHFRHQKPNVSRFSTCRRPGKSRNTTAEISKLFWLADPIFSQAVKRFFFITDNRSRETPNRNRSNLSQMNPTTHDFFQQLPETCP